MNHINSNILDPKPGPIGFIIKDYAAIPYGNQLMILHNGQQIKVCRNQQSARNFIQKQKKSK
jgi:hypothetical protein